MKKTLLFTLFVIMFTGCGSRTITGSNPPQNGPYNGVTTYHNMLVYSLNGADRSDYAKFDLYFEYTGLKLVVGSSTGDNGKLQIRMYGWNDAEILNTTIEVLGGQTQTFYLDLASRPAWVEFDVISYSGDLKVTMESYAK